MTYKIYEDKYAMKRIAQLIGTNENEILLILR
jgi:hypothetical protein